MTAEFVAKLVVALGPCARIAEAEGRMFAFRVIPTSGVPSASSTVAARSSFQSQRKSELEASSGVLAQSVIALRQECVTRYPDLRAAFHHIYENGVYVFEAEVIKTSCPSKYEEEAAADEAPAAAAQAVSTDLAGLADHHQDSARSGPLAVRKRRFCPLFIQT